MVDELNAAGLDAELIYQDTDFSIRIGKAKAYLSILGDDPVETLIDAYRCLVDEMNGTEALKSWLAYSKKAYYFHIEEMAPADFEGPDEEVLEQIRENARELGIGEESFPGLLRQEKRT